MNYIQPVLRLLFIVMLVCSPLGLQAQQTLSLDRCIDMALQTNKDIKAAHHEQKKYEYEMKALRANFYPDINLQASDLYSTIHSNTLLDFATPIGQTLAQQLRDRLPWLISQKIQQQIAHGVAQHMAPFNQNLNFRVGNIVTAGINVMQPLYMGGKISTGYRMGKLGAQMAALGETLTSEQTIIAVHEAYFLMVKAKELREVAVQYDSLLLQLTNDVQSALRNGMVSHNEEMKVKVKKSEAELKIKQAENGIRLARMNLCQVIGLPTCTMIDVMSDDEDIAISLIDAGATIEHRTEYQLLKMKSQLAEQQVKLERAEMMPQLGLSVNAAVTDGMKLMGQKILNHKPSFTIGVSLKIPISHGNQTRNKVKAAQEELARQRMEQASLCEKMGLELQQHANEVEEAGLELVMRQENLEQCAENLRISRKSYSVGYESLSDLLMAQLLWQQAYTELVETRYLLKIKTVKWRKAAGQLLQM